MKKFLLVVFLLLLANLACTQTDGRSQTLPADNPTVTAIANGDATTAVIATQVAQQVQATMEAAEVEEEPVGNGQAQGEVDEESEQPTRQPMATQPPKLVNDEDDPPQSAANEATTDDERWCPTRREVNDLLFGLDANGESQDRVVQVSTESGAWQVNTGSPLFTYTVALTGTGLIATIHEAEDDKAEVWTGDGSEHVIFRGTFRYAGCYSLEDDMNADDAPVRILVKENTDGAYQDWLENRRLEDWQYDVLPGNFTCPDGICPTANVEGNLVENQTDALPEECPEFAGQPTEAGNDGAPYCVYNGDLVTDEVPAGWKAQYWDGTQSVYALDGVMITTATATFRPLP